MSLRNPFETTPPARVDVASGWRAALVLADGTVVSQAAVLWPQSEDEQVREGRGRVDVEVAVNGGAWRPLAPVQGAQTAALVTPAAVGATIVARARFVKANGRPSTWTQSAPHVVVDPIASQMQSLYDSAADGWRGSATGAAVQTVEERSMASRDSWRDGFAGVAAGVEVAARYAVESTALADSLRDGWRGTGTGCETQPI